MGLFKRKEQHGVGAETAVADPPPDTYDDFDGTTEELLAEIERLTAANRNERDPERERRLLRLRHLAGVRLVGVDGERPRYPAPDEPALPRADGLPEIAAADVTPELLRAGILRDGCLLVRGLVDRDAALCFAELIDATFRAREDRQAGRAAPVGLYDEMYPDPRYEMESRGWVQQGGGVLAADAPTPTFEMLELFGSADVPRLVGDYLGERPLISVHKTTLRKAEPTVGGSWHQDGAFMGDVRALNLWLALSRCGDAAPGLDIVPRRLDHVVIETEKMLFVDETARIARDAAGEVPIVRPIFEPGDALLFDELFLHQTGSDPSMPNPRYAIESWFFGASGFPTEYAPIAV
jgi:Phytanoyl-CoA dioxygenase (PhyH)